MQHIPVLLNEVLEVFRTKAGAIENCFDGTFGRGGHTRAVLNEFSAVQVVAFDWDQSAVDFANEEFKNEIASGRLKIFRQNYSEFKAARETYKEQLPEKFDLMLLDLGVSSPQLDEPERGFSFYHDGPLDMRMDQRRGISAADIVNTWDEEDLNDIFRELGEIHRPYRVVRAIVHDRKTQPYTTTRQLASLIERVEGWQRKGFHPATRYFMALRLQVNEELKGIEVAIPDLIDGLNENGRLAVITFHSLEDRIVKYAFKANLHHGRLVNKKVITPTDEEIKQNPRSRSAKLRAFEKTSMVEKRNRYDDTDED